MASSDAISSCFQMFAEAADGESGASLHVEAAPRSQTRFVLRKRGLKAAVFALFGIRPPKVRPSACAIACTRIIILALLFVSG